MLVLTRKVQEKVVIGCGSNRITVTLLSARDGRAQLGIDAPPHVPVHRSEVAERLAAQGREQITSRE